MEKPWRARLSSVEAELIDARSPDGAWGYVRGGQPFVEPTALTMLALLSLESWARTPSSKNELRDAACRWLEGLQRPDGSVSNGFTAVDATWQTPYAILLWCTDDRWRLPGARAMAYLADLKGQIPVGSVNETDAVLPEATPGWPWTKGLPSWVEPTAMTLLAFKRCGQTNHRRVGQGVSMIRERAVPDGGWNYGNTVLFGADLRPLPSTTGLALAALASLAADDDVIAKACAYLSRVVDSIRSPRTLCWCLLALAAWGRTHPHHDVLVARAFDEAEHGQTNDMALSFLLLAATSPSSLGFLGIRAS